MILHRSLTDWMASKNRKPFPFQKETWKAYQNGHSGLLTAPTGYGKTLAVFLGPLSETLSQEGSGRLAHSAKVLKKSKPASEESNTPPISEAKKKRRQAAHSPLSKIGCQIIWITPLRALAADTLQALRAPIEDLKLPLSVEARTGDTSSYRKAKIRDNFPYCLVTTPESLSLLLTYPDSKEKFASVKCVIIDEWHELIGNKRGVQCELALNRLRHWKPDLRTWALSATFGNLAEAAQPLKPVTKSPETPEFQLISTTLKKKLIIDTLIPKTMESFPWSGHIGIRLAPQVCQLLEKKNTTLLFTNTRAQTEIWFQEISKRKPEWAGQIAIHHGSLSKIDRADVEEKLKNGKVRCVVCTGSLDLGIDFAPVDQVIQIGSPKGISRLIQRAGRSGHRPGETSRITCVPTNALELIEFSAAREAWENQHQESKTLLEKPLDVLVQHLATLVIGNPATPEELREEISKSFTYRDLSDAEWQWALDFITNGGALAAYPQYQKATFVDGKLIVTDKRIIQLHRMNIGKSATFRTRGIPIPEGDTAHDLDRITNLIKNHNPAELVIAGDLVHAADGLTSHTLEKLDAWLALQKISIILTEGNHDKKSRLPTFSLEIVPFHLAGEIHITHDPADLPAGQAGLAGHHHPNYRLRLSHRETHKFKGFHLRHPHHLILPAFSKFTGTRPITPALNDRFFAITPEKCHEIPLPAIKV